MADYIRSSSKLQSSFSDCSCHVELQTHVYHFCSPLEYDFLRATELGTAPGSCRLDHPVGGKSAWWSADVSGNGRESSEMPKAFPFPSPLPSVAKPAIQIDDLNSAQSITQSELGGYVHPRFSTLVVVVSNFEASIR